MLKDFEKVFKSLLKKELFLYCEKKSPFLPFEIKNGVSLEIAETISHDHSGDKETRHSIYNHLVFDDRYIVNRHLKQ